MQTSRPNFIIIFADDLGYGDIGPFGSQQHRTPYLDRLAEEGRKFTSFYVASSVCSPSRAALLTGSYPKRVSLAIDEDNRSVLYPGDKKGLNPDEITLAEILKDQGYATGVIGKWHLGDQPPFLPRQQGFDSYFGIPYSNDMGEDVFFWAEFPALPLMRNEEVIETEPDQALLTKRYTEEALSFIRSHQNEPFFLYIPHTMVHYPVFASPEFRGQSANGVYGDAVEEMDWSVGQIMETLRELDLQDNTLVIFTSDNGAAPTFGGGNGPLRGTKATPWEGGQREPCIMSWPGHIPAGSESDAFITALDILPTLARLAGSKAPTDRLIDGKDVWSAVSGPSETKSPRNTFYYYQLRALAAIRHGDWKLHLGRYQRVEGHRQWVPELHLFNLREDLGEQHDVKDDYPDKVAELQKIAAQARTDLGDDATGVEGKNVRPAGRFEEAKPLTTRSERAKELARRAETPEGPLPDILKEYLTFYASFDGTTRADLALGDPHLYTAPSAQKIDQAQQGLHSPQIRVSSRGGQSGGALQFQKGNQQLVFYRAQDNISKKPGFWGGTVSFWMNLSPDEDLAPGFCDPIQITDTAYNDAALWVDFTGKNPRDFRLGIFGDVDVWNPRKLPPNKDPNFERRLLSATDRPFERGQWTHVAFTFDGLDSRGGTRAKLYLNGALQGNTELIMEPFTWNIENATIRLGLNYIGGFDELAVLKRALTDEQVKQLYQMKSSIKRVLAHSR